MADISVHSFESFDKSFSINPSYDRCNWIVDFYVFVRRRKCKYEEDAGDMQQIYQVRRV